jgi:guanyl-specific ribonuclease Sa
MRALAARFALLLILAGAALHGCARESLPAAGVDGLPPEAIATLRLIDRGGPFPYRRDGAVFHNRERRLPARPPGHYREYTVPTPGARDRGARRLLVGGDPPETFFYTEDHYRSFRRIEPRP